MNKTTQRRPCPQGWPHGRGISGRMPPEYAHGRDRGLPLLYVLIEKLAVEYAVLPIWLEAG